MRRVVAWIVSAAFFAPAVVLTVAAATRPYHDNQRNWLVMGAVMATLCAVLAAGLVLACFGVERPALVQSPDYDIADSVEVNTVAQLHALGDPIRRQLLDLVLERAATVSELAVALRRPNAQVAGDVELLLDAGLMRVVRARPGWGFDEQSLGRTGRTINVRVAYRPDDRDVLTSIAELSTAATVHLRDNVPPR